ncbi:hypothetical protein D3C71_1516140 [compost metagenome]
MQALVGERAGHGFQILQRGAAGKVAARAAALAEARGAHTARAQSLQPAHGFGAQHGHAAQLRQGGQRVQQQAMVLAIGAGLDQHAVAQAQALQQRQIVGLQRFGRRIAAVGAQRVLRIGAEQMGMAVPARGDAVACGLVHAVRPWCCGKAKAGCWPSGSGISCALSVIATMV